MSAMKRNIGGLLAMAMMFEHITPAYNTGQGGRSAHEFKSDPDKRGMFSDADKKLQPFTIKGKTIMAGSRKDAIKIYNHQNKR